MNEHPRVMQEYENVVVVRFGGEPPCTVQAWRRRVRFSEVAFGLLLLSVLVGSGAALTGMQSAALARSQAVPLVRSQTAPPQTAAFPCHQAKGGLEMVIRLPWLNAVAMTWN